MPSLSALNEMHNEGFESEDILNVLEEGTEVEGKKRKEGVIEKVLQTGGRSVKVVVVESYSYALEMECWLIIHVKSVKI